MTYPPPEIILQTADRAGEEVSDRQLLTRFVAHHDADAFTALVGRHGRGVWGLCRRLLPESDAEDAFQAVFLVLARKAASIRKGEAVGSWLYGVAYRTALRVRRSSARRRKAETHATGAAPPQPPWGEEACRELQWLLDEEVQRLPVKYRAPFVLCCLEGMSKAEAAGELGWKEGTVSGRLAEARKLLKQRLARRGVTLSAVLTMTALALAPATATAAPPALAQAAAHGALTGKAVGLSPEAVALADGLLRTSTGVKTGIGLVLAALLLAAGAVAFQAAPAPPPPLLDAVDEEVWTLAFSPDGQRLVTAGGGSSRPGQLQIWDVAAGKTLVTRRAMRGVRSAAYSPDGQILATGHWGGAIKLRDPVTGQVLTTLTGHEVGVNGLAFSADGALLASAGLDKTVKLWDVEARRERQELRGHEGMVFGVAFFRRRQAVVSGGPDRTARIWDLDAGKERFVLRGHTHWVEAVAVSPDDKVVASGSWDKTIKFWDADTGKATGMLRQNGSNVQAVTFSPDGALLASAGSDGTVHLWDVASEKQLQSVRLHQAITRIVAFSPDGKLLASGGQDKIVRLWDVAAARPGATLSAVAAEASPDEPEENAPQAGSKGWAAAALMLGLLLALMLALGIYLRQRRRSGRKAPAGDAGAPANAVGEDETARRPPAEEPIAVACPGCGKSLKAGGKLAGKRIRCPQCSCAVVVPTDRD